MFWLLQFETINYFLVECNVFSDEPGNRFKTLDNRILNGDEGFNPVYSNSFFDGDGESKCAEQCIKEDCHVYSYGQGHCDVFSKADTMPFTRIINKVGIDEDFKIHIRRCVKC